jgi:phosphate transport system substrate-binding protein
VGRLAGAPSPTNQEETKMSRKMGLIALVTVLAILAAACGGTAETTTTAGSGTTAAPGSTELHADLLGAGATFPEPLYLEWIGEYISNVQPGVSINYQGIGSGGGIQQFIAQTTDFAGSDAYMKDDEIAAATDARGCAPLHIPMVFGAVAVAYNLPGFDGLVLDSDTLAAIFLGLITNFDDPAIAALNPGMALPGQAITLVHRSDASGTTNAFTTYLDDVSPEWSAQVGKGKEVDWPVGIGGEGNDGVAAGIQQNPGGLGYVELSYALENGLPVATMINADGNAIVPSLASTAAAANGIDIPDDLRFLVLGVGGDGYPIVTATWVLAWTCGYDAAKAAALKDYLTWALVYGDQIAEELQYAPIPDSLQTLALAKVDLINSEG